MDWDSLVNQGLGIYKELESEKIRATAPANPTAIEQPNNGTTSTGVSIPVKTDSNKESEKQKVLIYGAIGLGVLVIGAVAIAVIKD